MNIIKIVWQYIIIEPISWIFYSVFQPSRFKRDFEVEGFFARVIPMFRLFLPIFIICYPLALVIKISVYYLFPTLDSCCFPPGERLLSISSFTSLSVATLSVAVSSYAFAVLCGAVGGIAIGIASGLAFPIIFGIVGNALSSHTVSIVKTSVLTDTSAIVLGIIFGIVGGFLTVAMRTISRGGSLGGIGLIVLGFMAAIALFIASLIINSVRTDFTSGFAGIFALAIAASIAFGIFWFNRRDIKVGNVGYIVLAIIGGILLGIVISSMGGIQLNIITGSGGATMPRITEAFVGGLAGGVICGIVLGTLLERVGVVAGGIASLTVGIIIGGQETGVILSVTFIVSYLIGYWRLPLYPVSGISGLRAYLSSHKNPLESFSYLRHSSLYWDERVFLPLPYLKRTLLIIAGQNTEQALEEIAFIAAERPLQIAAARTASLELALDELELCNNINDIANASHQLAKILPQELGLIDPKWVAPFARLNDASRDAARYCSPLGRQARRNTLEDIITYLKRVHPNTAFQNARLNKRLGQIVKTWQTIIQQEQEKLEDAPETLGQIDNPYIPGPALELRNSLFVGRRDLVQQLEEALGRGNHRPTFFLNGERRMGKSSTLKQLPSLLGARYLPITYDLQTRGLSSSAAAFLGAIAGEICKLMERGGMKVEKLEYTPLRDASRENEAAAYRLFDEWLKGVEHTLEQEDRTLLLLFDEFEKLEEAGQAGYLDLRLLLDWFRSIIQNHPKLALLFSGVRTLGDMGASWAGYFVNVQTLRVSFLQPKEAYQLITQPVPGYPSEQIFGKEVVEKIIEVAGCHPFLVQAVCSALIDSLNTDIRARAEIQDVETAVNQVLENWWDTYFRDLWERTDQEQRTCLIALRYLDKGNLQEIAQQSSLDERATRNILQKLLKRNLVLYEKNCYWIATPIFREWVERNS